MFKLVLNDVRRRIGEPGDANASRARKWLSRSGEGLQRSGDSASAAMCSICDAAAAVCSGVAVLSATSASRCVLFEGLVNTVCFAVGW
tara:strand:- start:376 stop:639 length:264 start_codon:yes stop_codon:yes gene_type:complete